MFLLLVNSLGLVPRTLFLFLPSFYSSIFKKIHYYSSKPALLFSLSWWIFVVTSRFLDNFYILVISHRLSILAESSETPSRAIIWEGNKCQLCCSIHDVLKTYAGPPKMNIIKIPPHPSIIPAFLYLDAYYYSQNYSGIMFAGLPGTNFIWF